MSDQNQFDQYKQKLLHYWALFLAGCGTLWEKIKLYAGRAVEFLRRHGKILAQKLAQWGKAAARWLREMWERIRPYGKRLVQTLAAWLLLVKEKSEPLIAKAKVWIGAAVEKGRIWIGDLMARLPRREEALPAPDQTRALPEAEDDIIDAEPAEPEQVPVEAAPKNLPAWMSTPWVAKTLMVLGAIGMGFKFVFKWLCKLYKVFLAAPVVWYAVKFARENLERLPEEVGLDIQSTGEFARMISRQQAVYWPLGITLFCLLLMFLSKKPLLPWVISIFTLVLPWLIWILNYYA